MRERFGNWGAGLSDAEFACALAALGIVDPEAEASWDAGRLAGNIRNQVRRGPVEWRFEQRRLTLDASVLSKAWQLFVLSGGSGTTRIQLSRLVLQYQKIDPSWLRQQLQRPEVQAASVEIVHAFGVTRGRSYGPIEVETAPDKTGSKGTQSYEIESWESDRSTHGRGMTVTAPEVRPQPESSARVLQAWLQSLANPKRPRRISRALRPGGSYAAVIEVGPPRPGSMPLDKPIQLPEDPKGHHLTVVFEEPRVSPEPQLQTLWLPPTGGSRPVYFHFAAPMDGAVDAHITLLHANRVLQTGLLHAPVGRGGLTFKRVATPRAHLEGLAHRSQFDAAVIVNQDGRMIAASEDKAVVLSLDEGRLRALTAFLGSQISDISDYPERYASLESAGSRELLRKLAGMGAQVYRQLGLVRLQEAKRIHITSANAGSFLPIELIYRHAPPSKEAQICPHAVTALESGDCSAACPSDKEEFICPLGFWGLSRVIERHGPDVESPDGRFEIRAEPCHPRTPLSLSGSALLAASDKVSAVQKDAVTDLFRKLEARGPAALAKTWKDWAQHVEKDQPRLLVLLPHHERKDGLEVLEIGADDFLQSIEVHSRQVRKEPDGPHPIVLLMGCETHLAEVSFEGFATLFRSWGASVVVSTIATILGRHASPATAILVELLDEMAAEERTFGEVMLRLRQKLVAKATPMALGLTSYGDADWILTRKEV